MSFEYNIEEEIKKLGGGINIQKSNFSRYLCVENYEENINKYHTFFDLNREDNTISISNESSYFFNDIFSNYDDILYKIFLNNDENLKEWLIKGFNANILIINCENQFNLKNNMIKQSIEHIFQASQDKNLKFSIKLFSISYSKETKKEIYYSYFDNEENIENFKNISNIYIENRDQLKIIIERVINNKFFQENNDFFVINIKILKNDTLHSDFNYVFMNCQMILNQNKIKENPSKLYFKKIYNEFTLLLQKAKNLKNIEKTQIKTVLTKKTKISKFLLSSIFNNSKTIILNHITQNYFLNSPEFFNDLFEFQNRFKNIYINCMKNSLDPKLSKHFNYLKNFKELFETNKSFKNSSKKSENQPWFKKTPPLLDSNKRKLNLSIKSHSNKQSKVVSLERNIDFHEDYKISFINKEMRELIKDLENSKKEEKKENSQNFNEINEQIEINNPSFIFENKTLKANFIDQEYFPTDITLMTKETNLKIGLEEAQKNFSELEKINSSLQQKIFNLEQNIIEQKNYHEMEIIDYKNAIANLGKKFSTLSQDCDISEIINIYENEIIQLELKIVSLRNEINILTIPNPETKENIKNFQLLINKLNADITEKEKIIRSINKKNRENKFEEKNGKNLFKISVVKDNQIKTLNKKIQEQLILIQNMQNVLKSTKEENKQFSDIIDEISIEKDSLKNQNSILKTIISSQCNVNFCNLSKSTNKLEKENINNLNIKQKNIFHEMLNTIITEFKIIKGNNFEDFQNYFNIIEKEYAKLIHENKQIQSKEEKYLNFLVNIQQQIEKKYGRNDAFSKENSRIIRNFLMESANISFT